MRSTTPRVVLLAILLVDVAGGQELPRATTQHGAFAFPDPSGSRLIAVAEPLQPAQVHTALCSEGRRASVRFEGRQNERDGHDGRQAPRNFEWLAGHVFTILDGRLEGTATCFLASDALVSSGTPRIAKRAGPGECGLAVQRQLASARNRRVVNCWPIAELGTGGRVLLTEFAREGNDALASVVLTAGGRAVFADYPAEYRGSGADLWRVDDGGVLSPDGFEVVFLLERATSYVMGVSWMGSEGSSLAVFVSDGTDRFTGVMNDYWYQAPI